jgi:exopolyphosphatase / guanosine-5'-triphosphate,3'-diphosphate pyrophosphatase
MSRPVAVIDIGSNSIKVLVAARGPDGSLATVHTHTIDARISGGISQAQPHLSDEGIARGVEAVKTLMTELAAYAPSRTIAAATSAVRDASNGALFCDRVREATGIDVRVLSGAEEANLVGRGLTCDPTLKNLSDFYVFDLGGGSLECLSFRERKIEQASSLQLGCVRLTEKFISDVAKPLGRTARYRTMQHVHDELVRGSFKFTLPREAVAVGTGGTMTTVRAMLGARDGKALEDVDSFIPLTQLRLLLTRVSRMPLADRQQVPGLPAARADIFPVALATLIVLADVGAFPGFQHSAYNLRYGLADEALS